MNHVCECSRRSFTSHTINVSGRMGVFYYTRILACLRFQFSRLAIMVNIYEATFLNTIFTVTVSVSLKACRSKNLAIMSFPLVNTNIIFLNEVDICFPLGTVKAIRFQEPKGRDGISYYCYLYVIHNIYISCRQICYYCIYLFLFKSVAVKASLNSRYII